MKRIIQSVFAVIFSFFMVSESFAVGSAAIGNEVNSARSLGQGGASVAAVEEDPTTVYENPAGLTALKGTQLTLGGVWENLHGYYDNQSGTTEKMRSIDVLVPNFAATQSLMDGKLGVGLAAVSAYGLESHWPGDANSPLRYITTNSRLHIIDVTPAVAYQIHPMVSVGVGADYINVNTADLEKNVNMNDVNNGIEIANGLTPTFAGLADGDSKLTGTAANWGYHAGLTFQPTPQNTFGLVYHSKVKLNVNGTVALTGISGAYAQGAFGGSTFATSAFTDIYLPQNIQFGYAFKPNDKWTIEADTAWYDWNPDQSLNIRYPDATAAQIQLLTANGAGNPQPLNWRDNWSFETGTNYKLNDQLQLRGGFFYEPWVEPESAFSPDLLDLTRYGLAVGAGYAFTPSFVVDLAYNAIFFHNRTINNNLGVNSTGDQAVTDSGKYSDFSNLIALNFTYKFGGSK